ncbi:kelch repeat-containing protein [Larkinella bovis]|uniref:Kelch repeat-containing protein n=1 Tax=Larkinella bovis TaxID=683041 RepID=A0ABW0I3X0_9BACT
MKKTFLFPSTVCLLLAWVLWAPHAFGQWSSAGLSQSRNKLAGGSAGGKALFAGGYEGLLPSDRVDIYTLATNNWTTASLSQARGDMTAVSTDDRVFFAGGFIGAVSGYSKKVDIYTASTNSWTSTELSQARSSLASASAGTKVLFAGGARLGIPAIVTTVDVYDLTDNSWKSTISLSEARSALAGVGAAGKIFFAGGYKGAVFGYSKKVDIYDTATGTWLPTAELSEARSGLAAVAAGGKVFFAGGRKGVGVFSDKVDIYDTATGDWSTATLSEKRSDLTATTVGDKVFFAGGDTGLDDNSKKVDIYDLTTGEWSVASLEKPRKDLASAAVGNKALFAGGLVGVISGGGSSLWVDIYTATAVNQQPTPSSSTVCQGENVSTTITALGDELTYQWYKGEASTSGTKLDGQTSATLSLTGVQTSDVGSYYCQVSGLGGVAWSEVFTLSVNPLPDAPSITSSGQSNITVFQNTPYVSLTITGCSGGSVAWSGPGGSSGTNTSISVPTSATATLVYSATCTVGSCVSPAGSATVVVAPGTAVGSFDGYIYGADCSTFRGWAWDRNKINTAVSVEILDGSEVVATLQADVFRQDLKNAGKGNGNHAFIFPIPESLKDNKQHLLSARVASSSFILKDSPKALICQGSDANPGNKLPKPPSPTVMIAPIAAQIHVPFSATLVAFTDPEGTSLTYGLTGLPDGLTINSGTRVISGTPTVDGTFILTYTATDEGGASNSVSFNLTVLPVTPPVVTGSFEGYLDKVECGTIRGWVWDRNKPNTPVTVEFYTGGTVWGSTSANIFRQDLKDAGKGNGAHAYSFTVPDGLKDGTERLIYARVQGSTYDLKWSGKALTCYGAGRLSAEGVQDLQVNVLGNPVKELVHVEVRGAEGQSLQFALTDAQGRILGQHRIEKAESVQKQSFTIAGQPAGLLFLKVSTAVQNRTLKLLKL